VAGAEKGTLTFMVGASGQEFDTLQVTATDALAVTRTQTILHTHAHT
jgi:3-hydroxyisobutyrate dehydrogenase-like beta-hydroxyacid dehydrogenase